MPSYTEYLIYAKSLGFQPLSESAFIKLTISGFNPLTKTWG